MYKYVNSCNSIFLLFNQFCILHYFIELQSTPEHILRFPKCDHAVATMGTIIIYFLVEGIFITLILY